MSGSYYVPSLKRPDLGLINIPTLLLTRAAHGAHGTIDPDIFGRVPHKRFLEMGHVGENGTRSPTASWIFTAPVSPLLLLRFDKERLHQRIPNCVFLSSPEWVLSGVTFDIKSGEDLSSQNHSFILVT